MTIQRKSSELKDRPLTGLNILNTRPAQQAADLAAVIRELGGNSINFPTVVITHLPDNIAGLVKEFARFDIVIFMSSNAVTAAVPPLFNYWKQLPVSVAIAAVGAATASSLQQQGIEVKIIPRQFNSEGLLATPELTKVAQRNILIIRGQDGRMLIDQTLKQRGANVQEVSVYQRRLPEKMQQSTQSPWQQQPIDVILCTSIECMQNLFTLVGTQAATGLYNTPWLCISERVAQQVRNSGVKDVFIAINSDLPQALIAWAQQYKDSHHG